MATVTSATKFFPTAQEGFNTTTSGTVASAATTVGLNSVTGYNNGEVVTLVIDPTDAVKKQVFTGTVDTSGSQITGVVWTEGTNQGHALGATVVDYETATAWALYSKGMLVGHNQQGTHKEFSEADIVNTSSIKNSNVTTAKIADSAVTQGKIDFTSYTTGPNSMPLKQSSVDMGYTLNGSVFRVGNIVIFSMNDVSSTIPALDGNPLGEVIPAGYRPRTGTDAVVTGVVTAGANTSVLGWVIQANGSMALGNRTSFTGNNRIMASGVWHTDNAWPA